MLNRIILIGRVAVEPELRYTPNGIQVATFILAVDRPRPNAKGEKEADFIKIVVWRKLAEICAQYLTKGKLIAIDGRLQSRSYEHNGQKRKDYEVVAEDMRMLDRGKGSAGGPGGDHPDTQPEKDFAPEENLESIVSDDLPF